AADEPVWAGTASGLFGSPRGGRSWGEAALPAEEAPILSLAVSPHYTQEGLLLAGTEAGRLLRSTDQGQHWTAAKGPRPAGPVNSVLLLSSAGGGLSLVVLVHGAPQVSAGDGKTWSVWPTAPGVSAVGGRLEMESGAPLLVGYLDGDVQWAPPAAA